ncbi:SpvB/TcaC N-terminal domain-containing protein [Pseudomonas sp. RL_5y_Pfl2_73]|uniref:SpvB/TcaC N-terminal domain-containing protein n=2 Tax=unclassified Pseudomonas TaxID=196821 RepID=UPI0030D7C8AE
MDQQESLSITPPSLPKGGGAIQSIGKGWGGVGATGKASFDLPLPISPGRGYAPTLQLGYGSSVGNSLFGIGWVLSLGCVARRTSKGVPDYTDDDVILGPDGTVWMPERNSAGEIIRTTVSTYRDLALGTDYQVARYFPRIEGAFDRIEHWRSADDYPGFWLIHGADGSLQLYGFNPSSRSTDLEDALRVGEWLLEETMNAHGEHVLYEYAGEDHAGMLTDTPRDFRAQCYLSRVRYGNAEANAHLFHWVPEQLAQAQWHFDLIFDYGERSTGLEEIPTYDPIRAWPVRSDPFATYGYGFLLGNLRLCRQVLMFHNFEELGSDPLLVQRLLFDYQATELGYNLLSAAHQQGYDEQGQIESRPPVAFNYSPFQTDDAQYQQFEAMPGLNDGQQYQLVDLYGEGVPGVLYRSDKAWYYREPLRAQPARTTDEVVYDEWQRLDAIPVMDSRKPVRQSLMDLTGDGRLDWVMAHPGVSGFFTLNPDRSWSNFVTSAAFPREFFHPQSQLADLVGGGLSDLALIGPRSVRVYANRRKGRFAKGLDVPHRIEAAPKDRLPLLSQAQTELVAFSDVLGTGQQHLVRIRHNEIVCWPNRGHGRFDPGFRLGCLPYTYKSFDASRILLADLDGSGAADLIYLTSDHAEIYMNRTGMGFETHAQILPWPTGVRYDRLCQVSAADLQGLGCSSLVLTVPHMKPRHWRCDFVEAKPYLLHRTNNNMGAIGEVFYRSSAQEWLDEKQELRVTNTEIASYVPFPMPLVSRQTQLDEITGNQLTQRFEYRQGFYDGQEREFRGFGLVLQNDSEIAGDEQRQAGFTAPVLRKSWFHTGRTPDLPGLDYDASDSAAQPLGRALLLAPKDDLPDEIISNADDDTGHDMAYALAGMPLRVEVFGLDADDPWQARPYSVQQSRFAVRLWEGRGDYQPYCRMQPLELESIAYTYERLPDDPLCHHRISLAWDRYGGLIHEVTVAYARRRNINDEPPFDEDHEQTWWRASHDDAQSDYYLSESRAQFLHLDDDPQAWRLGLPYRSRGNALVLPKAMLGPEDISHEAMFDRLNAPPGEHFQRQLAHLSEQRYQQGGQTLPTGEASFEALADYLESAELDEAALQAYASVLSPEELDASLPQLGYHPMAAQLPAEPDKVLWSIRKGFMTYAGLEGFYRVISSRATQSQGPTDIGFDPYYCLPLSVTTADGCSTHVVDTDYRFLLPRRIVDPNQNIQEARYDGFGELSASSFHGTERGENVGFDPLDEHQPFTRSPTEAIANPEAALQGAASACFRDPFSWMREGEPVHAATLQADRYPQLPDNPERKIRIAVQCWDGFGRVLQSKQKVEPGNAYQIADDGTLVLDGDDQPVTAPAAERWRVSERVEYNNKGLAVRVYRPYFADGHRYIKDESFRRFGHCDQQFYDPLGRPTLTVTAMGYWRRQRYLGWYGISEDENDTLEESSLGNPSSLLAS